MQRFADKFGEYDPAVVIDSLKAKTSGIRRAAGNRLEQVQNAMAGVNIQPARAIQQIDTEISNLQKLGKVADNETISKLQSYRDELVRNAGPDGPVNLDLEAIKRSAQPVQNGREGERPVLPNRSDAAIQRVYKAMTDLISMVPLVRILATILSVNISRPMPSTLTKAAKLKKYRDEECSHERRPDAGSCQQHAIQQEQIGN